MKVILRLISLGAAVSAAAFAGASALAGSHQDAPLISLDPPANTTDLYAFVSEEDGVEYLTAALTVFPFEEPGAATNNYQFDDNVLYEIHIALGRNIAAGHPTRWKRPPNCSKKASATQL